MEPVFPSQVPGGSKQGDGNVECTTVCRASLVSPDLLAEDRLRSLRDGERPVRVVGHSAHQTDPSRCSLSSRARQGHCSPSANRDRVGDRKHPEDGVHGSVVAKAPRTLLFL